MVRKLRAPKIENRTNRLQLPRRRAPHGLTNIAPGIRLGYRRCKGAGTWVAEMANGRGGEVQFRVAVADDFEDADGTNVLSYWEAIDKARAMARGTSGNAPATWASALDDYEADLKATGREGRNATRVRYHTPPAFMTKPVALLTAAELRKWRNALLAGKLKPASVVRILKAAKAMLNAAADHDPKRITERPWRVALGGLVDTYTPVDKVQPDHVVQRLIAEAYGLDEAFGLFIHVAAETAARASQIARLLVADLQADDAAPKLLMPSSRKGRRRTTSRQPVPISLDLAGKLKQAAGRRATSDPLLLRNDGTPWRPENPRHLQHAFAEIARRVGIDETMYCLRHSAIVRALLAGVPARLAASNADTSLVILERVYSRYISSAGEDVARRGLLGTVPSGANVIGLPGRR
jgi:integrase